MAPLAPLSRYGVVIALCCAQDGPPWAEAASSGHAHDLPPHVCLLRFKSGLLGRETFQSLVLSEQIIKPYFPTMVLWISSISLFNATIQSTRGQLIR